MILIDWMHGKYTLFSFDFSAASLIIKAKNEKPSLEAHLLVTAVLDS